MRRSAALLLALWGAACTTGTTAPRLARVNVPFTLAVGEVAAFPDEGFSVRFTGVPGDSRCPGDVVCVWEGDGAVLIEIAPPAGDSRVDTLHTTLDPRATAVGARVLSLERLDPYPRSDRTIEERDYRATFLLR
jgi:hypothetical protein